MSFLQIGILIDYFHYCRNSSLFQTELITL
jgi:hypothetical protein